VLLGEQRIHSEHVLAALWAPLDASDDQVIVAARGRGAWQGKERLQAESGVVVGHDGHETDPPSALVDVATGRRRTPVVLPDALARDRYLHCLHIFEEAGGELPFAVMRPLRPVR
jgi:hypothetical protein